MIVAWISSDILDQERWKIFRTFFFFTIAVLIIDAIGSWFLGKAILRRKSAEQALQKSHEALELRVDERTAKLNRANKLLKREIDGHTKAKTEQERLLHNMGERVKELTCMYEVAKSIRKQGNLESVFRDIVEIIPIGLHYPEITRARIYFDVGFRGVESRDGAPEDVVQIGQAFGVDVE